MSLLGRVQHSLDDKGRIVLPSQYRDLLPGALYLTLGDDRQVALWPEEPFQQKLAEKTARQHEGLAGRREFLRFTANTAQVKMDGQSRISIPEPLRAQAGLDRNRPLTIVGAGDRVEIWDTALLEAFLDDGMGAGDA
jgi:MraZ protein